MRAFCIGLVSIVFSSAAIAAPFKVVALGDMPYGEPEKVNPPYEKLISAVNQQKPDLVLHVGDTKSGSIPCSNELLDNQLRYMNSFVAPTLYTPGDNEWTDCYRKKAGVFDPLERLAYLRKHYFAKPELSFGQKKLAVQSQHTQGYPENIRVLHKQVMFVTTHVVGSNNNLEARDLAAATEFFARDKANIQWLNSSFEQAKKSNVKALVLAIHADMFEFDFGLLDKKEEFLRHSGFINFANALIKQSNEFGKPVLIVFGDSHVFRVFRPFRTTAPLITALEVFGDQDMHAVEVQIDTDTAFPFAIRPLINPEQPLKAASPSGS